MGCGSSKNKGKNKNDAAKQRQLDRANTRGTRTPRVLNDWGNNEPIPAPYPQGNKNITETMKADSMQAGTIYDPNPELVEYEVEGELVPASEFYSITPIKPIKGLAVDKNRGDKAFIDDNRDTQKDRNRNRDRVRQVDYA